MVSSRSGSTQQSEMTSHMDVNDTEMFSGAASNAIPTSISSFHHHHHFRSPTLSVTSSHDDQNIDRIVLDRSEVNENAPPHPNLMFMHQRNDENLYGESDNESELDGYESEASEFQERSKFRFFKSADIEAAKGVSSLGRFSSDNNHESVKIDYDTNWNSFADDYSTDHLNDTELERTAFYNSHTKLTSDDGSNSNNSYGSIGENPYSEFFRGDAERELVADEEQDLHIYGEQEGDETFEDMITKKAWLKTMKQRESLKMHDKFFKKFPAKKH